MSKEYVAVQMMTPGMLADLAARQCSRTPSEDAWNMYDAEVAAHQKQYGIKKEFSDTSRRKLVRAHEEAVRFGHAQMRSEHLLISLVLGSDAGIARTVLLDCGIGVRKIRIEIERLVQEVDSSSRKRMRVAAPCLINALKCAEGESNLLNFPLIGTEHLLLGLMKDEESLAVQVLKNLNVRPADVTSEVYRFIGVTPELLNVHLEEDARLALCELQRISGAQSPSETILELLRQKQ